MSSFSRGQTRGRQTQTRTRTWNIALGALVAVVFGACVAAGVLAVLGTRAQSGLPCEGRAAVAALADAPALAGGQKAPLGGSTAHLLQTVSDAVRTGVGSGTGATNAVIRLATWCPFACVLVAVDTPAQRQAVFDSLIGATNNFQRAGNAPFTARLTGVPYDNLVYVVLKKAAGTSTTAAPTASADDDDPTPAMPAAEVLTPARARALRALNTVFKTTHYVTPKRRGGS
jgi:hypothetical protein